MKKILAMLIAISCVSMSANAKNTSVQSERKKAIERVEITLDAEMQELRKTLVKEIKFSIKKEVMQTCKSDKEKSNDGKNLLAIL